MSRNIRPSVLLAPSSCSICLCKASFSALSCSTRCRKASTCSDCRRRSVSDCAANLFKASVNCLSNSVIQLPHSLDSFKYGRPSTVKAVRTGVPGRQRHVPLPADFPQPHAPRRLFDLGQHLAPPLDPHVRHREGLDPVLDAPRQPLHRRPASAEDAEPKTQADDQGPEPRLQQQLAHPPGRLLRIALDGTQRVPRDAPRVLAEPL